MEGSSDKVYEGRDTSASGPSNGMGATVTMAIPEATRDTDENLYSRGSVRRKTASDGATELKWNRMEGMGRTETREFTVPLDAKVIASALMAASKADASTARQPPPAAAAADVQRRKRLKPKQWTHRTSQRASWTGR